MEKKDRTAEIVKLWKELKVTHIEFEFYCGGDSMGDTNLSIYGKDDKGITNDIIQDYFDDEVYNNVDFYVNSDGHYQGESGNVHIELNDDEDGFDYSKSAQSEWCESIDSKVTFELSDKEFKLISNHVININGGDGGLQINYKDDFILDDTDEEVLKDFEERIDRFVCDFIPDNANGEVDDWYSFGTDDENNGEVEDDGLEFDENNLVLYIQNTETIYSDSE